MRFAACDPTRVAGNVSTGNLQSGLTWVPGVAGATRPKQAFGRGRAVLPSRPVETSVRRVGLWHSKTPGLLPLFHQTRGVSERDLLSKDVGWEHRSSKACVTWLPDRTQETQRFHNPESPRDRTLRKQLEDVKEDYTQSRGSRREVLLTFPTLVLGGLVVAPAPVLARTTNLEEARRRGEEAREIKAETETPGELIVKESGLKFREIEVGTKGNVVVPGATVEIKYTVWRLSSGAYFKESSGGKPVYLWSLGYAKEGKATPPAYAPCTHTVPTYIAGFGCSPYQNDLGETYRLQLGEVDMLPPAVTPAVVGMRQGGVRRVLVPPRYGWAANSKLQPKPDTFGSFRRLENHKEEPLLFDVEVVKVYPPEKFNPEISEDELDMLADSLLPKDYNRVINRPPPSALSYNSVVYKQK